MRQIKNILIFFCFILGLYSCVKPFDPKIDSKDTNKYVVSGQVTNIDGFQTLTISKTSSLNSPEYIPVIGCFVMILDDKGNEFYLYDNGNGIYSGYIDLVNITPASLFKVKIVTRDGIKIESDFDRISSSPPVDSIYYMLKSVPTSDPGIYQHGIQYYINLDGNEANSRYYRWEAIETYEYHAQYPLIWYYDGSVHKIWPPDSSRMVCWRTSIIPTIFTLSTTNLSENKYRQLPLQFVDNQTTRLAYGYSLLIHQYALSEEAYIYWDKMRINSSGQGGLYEKQPMAIKGNLHNLTHPEEDVLGFFGATMVTSKRIFTWPPADLILEYSNFCSPELLGMGGFTNIAPSEYPAGLMGDENTYYGMVMNAECYNCLKLGGTNIKPEFWPK